MYLPHIFIGVALLGFILIVGGIQLDVADLARTFQNFLIVFVLDQQIHNFVGAGPDLAQSNVPDHFFDGIDVGVPDAAHDLHGFVGNLPAGIGGKALGLANDSANIG